ncbi:MAG: hypothetical protein ACXW32_15760 [Limisphaerales bacterium]
MTKIAIFVEGQTELLFMDRLILELASESGLAVEHAEATGGATRARQMKILKRLTVQPHHQYYVLIVNCAGDSNVKSDIIERYTGLKRAGYSAIFGLRDVYGMFRYEDVSRLRSMLKVGMPEGDPPIHLFLAIMEIEAWLLGEYTHFQRFHPSLTMQRIQKHLRFDPKHDDLERRWHPAEDMDRIYQLAGGRYTKQRNNLERTLDLLDFRFFISNVSRRFSDAARLISLLGNQLSS